MRKLLTPQAIREIEALAIADGISEAEMMKRAGTALARQAAAYLRTLPADIQQPRVTILVGPGNNGSDGLVAGLTLAENTNALVRFYLVRKREDDDPLMQPILDAGYLVTIADDDLRYRVLIQLVASADLVIDALYGIGTQPPLRPEASKLLRAVTQALNEQPELPLTFVTSPVAPPPRPARPYVIACDCPSGIDADTGAVDAYTLHADETVTFIAPKPGLFLFPAAAHVGKLGIASLGLPEKLKPFKDATTFVADASYVAEILPKRPLDAHKGTFGKALIVGGSVNYIGAPALAAGAAYRSGAGLVVMVAGADIIQAHAGAHPEITWIMLPSEDGIIAEDAARLLAKDMSGCDALVVGPGIGTEAPTAVFLAALLNGSLGSPKPIGFATAPAVAATNDATSLPPLVLDADALNLIARKPEDERTIPQDAILTPHPGEMARLCGVTTAEVQADRLNLAREKAKAWRCIILLKGAHSIVAAPDGRVAILPIKTSALATAGTGDVLAGLCGGFLAQGMKPFEAAVAAAYVHGFAGQLAEQSVGSGRAVIASDVLAAIGQAFGQIEGSR
jgi:ADP-dependent NAD(P)H-hydrate dehydratase / NAD(P)H-hydrate epimerase